MAIRVELNYSGYHRLTSMKKIPVTYLDAANRPASPRSVSLATPCLILCSSLIDDVQSIGLSAVLNVAAIHLVRGRRRSISVPRFNGTVSISVIFSSFDLLLHN